jgi:peptide/nickel transport system substrate-binding protein
MTEGEVAPARFINPVLAISTADQDLSELVYSGLLRAQPDGSLIPDLASSYTVSSDGLVYTFKLRPNATFHDGSAVTANDVAFTVALSQNADIRSPRRADWMGVTVTAPDAHTIVFTLPHAYAPFIENTTMGVLPQHLWKGIAPSECPFSLLNTHPIGSGPYQVASVATDETGAPTNYDMVPFSNFTLGAPYIKHLKINFYQNNADMRDAFASGDIDAIAGVTPSSLKDLKRKDASLSSVPLPRIYGVFFNANHNPALADASVRAALNAAIDPSRRSAIVSSVLGGFGVPLSSPLLPKDHEASTMPLDEALRAASSSVRVPDPSAADSARAILSRGGWQFNDDQNTWTKSKATLNLTLATADEPELVATAKAVAGWWRDAGINVNVQIFSLSDLNSTVIRPRSYDMLLFGEVTGRENDLYSFWQSTQRNDPGLNLSLYTNAKADTLLTQARATTDDSERQDLYAQFADLIAKDQPAVFLYAPEFLYVTSSNIHGINLGSVANPSDRFSNVSHWYIETKNVWNVFAKGDEVDE